MKSFYKIAFRLSLMSLTLLIGHSHALLAQDINSDVAPQKEVQQDPTVLNNNGRIFEIVKSPQMNADQEKYLDAIIGERKSIQATQFSRINNASLTAETRATLNLPELSNLDVIPYSIDKRANGKIFWKGRSEDGKTVAKFIINGNMVTGQVQTADQIYQIRPLTEGLHVVVPTEFGPEHDCGYDGKFPQKSNSGKKSGTGFKVPDDEPEGERKSSAAECDVRLMVVYTNSVDNLSPNIADLIELEIDNFNDINNNSDVSFNVTLARSLEVNYNETNQELQHPQVSSWDISRDLYRLWHPNDGWMDNVHTERGLYDADMVLFMVDQLPGYGGLAFNVGVDAADAFCIMTWNNGNHTFTHEFGHLIGMWHNVENSPGTSSSVVPFDYGFAHYWTGIGPNFRTVMSYSNPCGSAGCPRIPYWSNPDLDYGIYNISLGASNKDNARVANEQEATISNFQHTITNKRVFTNTTVRNRETGNLIANASIDSDHSVVRYYNGSSGEYRAPQSITLRTGFRAYPGSNFRARISNCFNFTIKNTELATTKAKNESEAHPSADLPAAETEMGENSLRLEIFPNPVLHSATVQYNLEKASDVSIGLYDVNNRLLRNIVQQTAVGNGIHTATFDVSDLPAGIYMARLQADEQVITRRVVVAKR